MHYTTKILGTPYGEGGEAGPDTDSPAKLAQDTLRPGQRLLCYAVQDDCDMQPHRDRRYDCYADGTVEQVVT